MPRKPPHACNRVGCSNTTHTRFCDACGPKQAAKGRAHRERELEGNSLRAKRLYRQKMTWRQMRARHVKRQPFCVECAKAGIRKPVDEVDHIVPHRGNTRLFFDPNNLQSLCKPHHSAKTALEVGFVKRKPKHATPRRIP